MAKHAWDGYVAFAWGENELAPVSRGSKDGSFPGYGSGAYSLHDMVSDIVRWTPPGRHFGASIIDAFDTLHIMGLTAEATVAQNWIFTKLNFDRVRCLLRMRVTTPHRISSFADTVRFGW